MTTPSLEADILIAGGGAAACVIAGRLTSADPNLKILILERGPLTLNDPGVIQPATFLNNLLPTSPRTLFYEGEPSEHLAGRAPIVQAGGCLGGGSAINFMMYTRGSASDYDDWEKLHGNPGWGFADLKPLFNKTETYQIDDQDPDHGHSGPIKISYGGHVTAIAKEWLQVATTYDKSRTVVPDPNNFVTSNSYGRWQKWIDGKTGRRQDAAHAFVYPHLNNKNLVILPHSFVDKVLFEGDRAIGVQFVSKDGKISTALARKLVVLSTGTLSNPQILERSGIGSSAVLKAAGVDVLVESPSVGENYQDHNFMFTPYRISHDDDKRDDFLRGDPEVVSQWTQQWYQDGSGMLASNIIDAGGKVRPSPKELEALGEDFKKVWGFFERAEDKPVVWYGLLGGMLAPQGLPSGTYFTAGGYTMHPFSRGSIHIRSANPQDRPKFNPGYLSHPADLQPLVWQYKLSREVARRMPSYRGELAVGHPVFPEGSEAACKEYTEQPPYPQVDIKYSAEDNAAIEAWVRNTVATTWHSMGTCVMAPKEKGGVVDPRLSVYGIQGLKVADLSVCPGNVAANTYSTALVVGEKAAVIIGEDLGISGV